jgi:hypothetical protein
MNFRWSLRNNRIGIFVQSFWEISARGGSHWRALWASKPVLNNDRYVARSSFRDRPIK